MNEKQLVGEKAVEYVKDGMIVGLGTGSTAYYTIVKLGEMVKQGLQIQGIPTSKQTEELANKLGIPLTTLDKVEKIDVAIDGADEVDPYLNVIKGGGGALLREKIIARAAEKFIVVADSSKNVHTLGSFPLPVEVIPFGYTMTARHIEKLGGNPRLRKVGNNPYITDNGNYILDVHFREIPNPEEIETQLNLIPGVVENGLFVGMVDMVITYDEEKGVYLKNKE